MPRLIDIAPPESRSILERRRVQRQRAEQRPTFGEQFTAATQLERIGAEVDRRLRRAGYRYDPDFTGIDDLPEQTRSELLEGIPTEQIEAFGEARSLRHAKEIARQQREILKNERTLAQAGISGLGARMLAAVSDPAALATEVVTGGTVGAFSRGSRLASMVRSGLTAGATEASIEGFVGSSDPTRGVEDVLYAGVGGGTLGAGAGALGRNFGRPYRVNRAKRELVEAARHIRRNVEFEDLKRTAGDAPLVLSDRGKGWFRQQAERHVERRTLREMVQAQGFEGEDAEALDAWLRSDEFETLVEARATTPDVDTPQMAGRAADETEAERLERVTTPEQRAGETTAGQAAPEPLTVTRDPESVRTKMRDQGGNLLLFSGVRGATREAGDVSPFYTINPAKAADYADIDEGGAVRVVRADDLPEEVFSDAEGTEVLGPERFFDEMGSDVGVSSAARADVQATAEISPDEARQLPSRAEAGEGISISAAQAEEAAESADEGPDLLGGIDPGGAPRLQAGDFEARLQDDTGRFGRARVSIVGVLGRSDSPRLRQARNAYMPDPIPLATDRPQHTDALSWSDRKRRAMNGAWLVFTKNRFERWAQQRGVSVGRQKLGTADWDEFQQQVGRGVRRPAGSYTSDPNLNEVIEFTRRYYSDLLSIGQRHNVRGLEDIDPSDTFFTRLWSKPDIDRLESELGTDQIVELLTTSMRRGSDADLPDDLLRVAARAMLKNVRRVRDFSDLDQAMMLRGKRPDLLREALRAEGLADEQVERLAEMVNPPDAQAPITSRAKHRVNLDETTRIGVTRKDGTRTELGIEDLLNNNAAEVTEIATRQMLGAAAESEVFRAFSKDTGRTVQSYNDLRRLIEEDMVEAGVGQRKRSADLARLDTVHRAVAGIPLGEDSVAADVMRGARNFMHITTAGQFGVMQIPEAARIVSATGFSAMIDAMPALSRVFRRAQDGQLDDEFLREIESLGYGLDYVNSIVHNRIDEQDAAAEMAGTGLDRMLRRGARASMVMGGLTPIMTAQQRMAVAAMSNRLAQWAFTGRKIGKRRLLGIGLDEQQADKIVRQIRNYSTTEQGFIGRRVRRLNIDRWNDQEAAANLVRAFDRFSRRAIQESDVGSLARWMTTDTGRLVTQYRTFQFQAWEKGVLYNLAMQDMRTFTELTTATMTAGLLYAAQQHVIATGREDRAEYLKERLSPGNIARIAFQRAGFSSFIPEAVDGGARLMGREGSLFTGRVSQLSTLDAFGNPVIDAADDALGLVRDVGSSVQGLENFTADDFRRAKSLIPFSRVLGVSNVLDALGSELPEE